MVFLSCKSLPEPTGSMQGAIQHSIVDSSAGAFAPCLSCQLCNSVKLLCRSESLDRADASERTFAEQAYRHSTAYDGCGWAAAVLQFGLVSEPFAGRKSDAVLPCCRACMRSNPRTYTLESKLARRVCNKAAAVTAASGLQHTMHIAQPCFLTSISRAYASKGTLACNTLC